MQICKIISENREDFEYLSKYLEKYPVSLLGEMGNLNSNIPTLIVGWKTIKKYYQKQNIFDKEINKKLSWTYGRDENEKDCLSDIEAFINKSIKKWLPQEFILFDLFFSSYTLSEFIEMEIKSDEISYFYFYNDALYIRSGDKNLVINLKSLALVDEFFKEAITNLLNDRKAVVFSYKNISPYVNLEKIKCLYTFENIRWVKYKQELKKEYFNIIPGFEIDKYIPFIMSKTLRLDLNQHERKSIIRACKRDIVTEWLSNQTINFRKNFHRDDMEFIYHGKQKLCKVSYSNKRTLTGRIVPIGKYNPQNLPKSTEERADIVSRFDNGKIVSFDYTSFEARIALYFCGDNDFIHNYQKSDLHFETAKILFGRDNISDENRTFAKNINHSILYGAAKKTVLERISYLNSAEEIYYNILNFLSPILKKSKEIFKVFRSFGYVVNEWGTMVYPEKDYAAFNNYIQSMATEILIDKTSEIKKFLSNYKSKMIFQVHDSLVFDISPDENFIIKELAKIIMKYKEMSFSVTYSRGLDYKYLSKPIEILDSC